MSGVKKATDLAAKARKAIDWDGLAKMLVSEEARKEFANLRRTFEDVNHQLQTKYSQSGVIYFQMLISTTFQFCKDTAKKAWKESQDQSFNSRTKHLAGALKKWKIKKKPLQHQLNELEGKIKEIQEKPIQDQDYNEEEKLVIAYDQTLTRLTEYYKQRAKKHWATQGDRNTRYFHTSVLKRRRRNRIVSINNPQDIIQDDYTNSIPDEEEVWNILKGMRNDASPGPDGFNAAFYKAAWKWIGKDVTELGFCL